MCQEEDPNHSVEVDEYAREVVIPRQMSPCRINYRLIFNICLSQKVASYELHEVTSFIRMSVRFVLTLSTVGH